MFKVCINIAPPIFTEIFNKQNLNYQLRPTSHFSVLPVRSVCNGTENLSLLGSEIWDIGATVLKDVKNLSAFKSDMKTWWSQNCPCRLWKRYLPNIGFIQTCPTLWLVVTKHCACLIKAWVCVTLSTVFKWPNVKASQRFDSVMWFMIRVLANWLLRILSLLLLKFIGSSIHYICCCYFYYYYDYYQKKIRHKSYLNW